MIDEQRYRALIQQLASGGIAGNKTYHQVRDQYMPMDSESMGYMNGGGIGSMMQPRMNFAGGGGDFEPLGYQDESITVEDLTNRNNGNFLISAANALDNQTGTINSAPSITNSGVNTIEGSLIDGDDITSRYDVQKDFKSDRPFDRDFSSFDEARMGNSNQIPDRNRGQIIERNPSAPFNRGFTMADVANTATGPFDRDFSSFDEARMGAPANSSLGYQDRIMGMVGNDPFAGMNALEKDIAKQAMNTSQAEFDGDFNSEFYNDDGIYTKQKGESILAENRKNPLKNFLNKDTNMFGYQKKPTGPMTGIMEFMSKIPTPMNLVRNMMNPNPNAPSYKTYSPNIDYSKLNTTNLNDFYDDNPESDTYGTTRFDRAKKGSFGSFRTLADYFNRNKSIVDTGKKAAADKKAQDAIKAAEKQRAKEAATADRARAANASVYASADRQGFTDGRGGGFGSRSTGTNDAFSNNSGRGRTGYQDGGIVSLRK